MIILQINSTLNWGSTGHIAEDIGQTVIMQGWENYIAYGRYCNKSDLHSLKVGNSVDNYMHVLQTRLFDRHGLASVKATKRLIKKIKCISPDIIHLHNIHGYYLNYSVLFKFLAEVDVPIVWTLHDCWPFTGHCSHYTYAKCSRWQTGCFDCPQKKRYPCSWWIDRSRQNYQDKLSAFTSVKNMTLVPVSEWLAREVRQSFLKDYPIRVIHNGIDLNVFTPKLVKKQDLGIDDKFVILGVASIWSSRKGLLDFIQLRKKLSDKYLIVLIGLDNKQLKTLPKGIIGIKRTNSMEELAKYYSVADVFFNPTLEDNFPTTNLEALACGTPVPSYRTGGSIEAFDANTGFVVEQGDVNAALYVIETLFQYNGTNNYLKKCRERAMLLWNKHERYREYIQLYSELVKHKENYNQ